MPRTDLSALAAFLVVADEHSFTAAAKRLSLSPSAVSHAMRELEEGVGVRLLSRTTRSMALTEAGEQLLLLLRPALSDVQGALDQVGKLRSRPAGKVRLLVTQLAANTVLGPRLKQLATEYPDILLEVTTDDSRMDIVQAGFDAGIQIGEYIQKDMVAVRVSPDITPAIVASPAYLLAHGIPKHPRDLVQHVCINYRHGNAPVYKWEFERGKKEIAVAVHGPLVVDNGGLVLQAALQGVGLAYVPEGAVTEHLNSGALERVLKTWCQPFYGFFIYYPSRRQQLPAVTAIINLLRVYPTADDI